MRCFRLAIALLFVVGILFAKPEEGKTAPAFDVPATSITTVLPDKKDAKTLSLADLKGRNVVT